MFCLHIESYLHSRNSRGSYIIGGLVVKLCVNPVRPRRKEVDGEADYKNAKNSERCRDDS